MGAGTEKAGLRPSLHRCHGVLGLVAVAGPGGTAGDGHRVQGLAADAVQGVGDPLGLGPQLLFIAHMPEHAAAAVPGIGAGGLPALRTGPQHLQNIAVGRRVTQVGDFDFHPFAPDSPGHKDRQALHPGHALALAGVAGDLHLQHLAQGHGICRLFHVKHSF